MNNNNTQESLYSKEAFGKYGYFSLNIMVGATRLPDLEDDLIREAGYKAADLIEKAVMTAIVKNDPDAAAAAVKEREEIVGLFPKGSFVTEIDNGYCSDWCCKHLPWFNIFTSVGMFTVGWRKRVIQIDWSRTSCTKTAEQLFPTEDVTKQNQMMHAWSLGDAQIYINRVLKS